MASRVRRRTDDPPACPCGSGHPYGECCAPLHQARATAPTAVLLMRSRFSAFAVGDPAYLLRTWHPRTRPGTVHLDPAQRWTGLDIVASSGGGLFDATGTVEFRAHYRHRGTPGTLSEHSRFLREDGHWLYLDALPPPG